ncbi:MAG: glycogen/starch/alpha-glucan phosphorylase [Anaeroplasma bactoclasticum]|nr:glycogen/starch/alpha-glucan phosphorylase [Anaeroplasma bactoclasticum]
MTQTLDDIKGTKHILEEKLASYFGVTPQDANIDQMYKAVSMSVLDILLEKKKQFNRKVKAQKAKRIYYLCMEFLVGRSLKTNLYNLGIVETYRKVLEDYGFDLDELYGQENDAGLGNGGLGRLAACFMDSLASLDYPATGFSIRYEYGLFKQKIVNGWQTEMPDVWLPGGEVWLVPRSDRILKVRFGGWVTEYADQGRMKVEYHDSKLIEAVPYDMLISGGKSEAVSTLRLWRARNATEFDMKSFSQGDYQKALFENQEAELISKVLYPSDDHREGKTLRLKQQYFLVSASIQNIIYDHVKRYGDLHTLPDYAAIHINDTHPAICIPELMRILMDDYGMGWDESWDIVTKTVAYTNHTVLVEALESWSEDLVARTVPRIYAILKEINKRYTTDLWSLYPGDWDKINRMAIISSNHIKMANLSVVASHSVNGVSALHSDIIKRSIFSDYYQLTPDKFTNVTNGIAHRRWLHQSNPRLSNLLMETIGEGWYKDAKELSKFMNYHDDDKIIEELGRIKLLNKCDFANVIYKKQGIILDPKTRFDVQVKRLHEYKRQLLNVLKIIHLYNLLRENPDLMITPQTFIFGAKAAPGYYLAKEIIELINYISKDIDMHPRIKEKLNVVFIEDYCVTLAESLMPASEISEQISLAGYEASGTGNMKFMINGAITFGTMDGANVEICDAVGDDNIFIFGMTTKEVDELWKQGYNSTYFYNNSKDLRAIIATLKRGFAGKSFENIANYLLTSNGVADRYMCLADFDNYLEVYQQLDEVYAQPKKFHQMSLVNIAQAGRFAADRSIKEYSEKIWHIRPVK